MSRKPFKFRVENLGSSAVAEFVGEGAGLAEAFAAGVCDLNLSDGRGLVLFRFVVVNSITGATAAVIGQGVLVREAWSDALKGPAAQFRPKNDGRMRESMGLRVRLASGLWENRSIADFEKDELLEAKAQP